MKTILVAEDNLELRKVVTAVLRDEGYHVLEASDPAAAASIIGSALFSVDLLFADIMMPSMSGPEFARELLGMCPQLKVVFSTGSDEEAVHRSTSLVRHQYCLRKPFTPEQLKEAVSNSLAA